MSTLRPPTKEYELQDIPRGLSVHRDMDRPRGSSAMIANFQTVKHIQQNEFAAEQSRKTSRLSRGLDPNVPRPKHPPQCICLSNIEKPKDEKEQQ